MPIAINREVSPAINRCELTHLQRQSIDVALAQRQHTAYTECLRALGCDVRQLPAEADLPDSVFVEDIAIVLDEIAVITRPGAESRRPERESIAAALKPHRRLAHIQTPATLDGGDVLRVGNAFYVGVSSRSNMAGVEQLHQIVDPFGYTVAAVAVQDCLHLKSAVTQVAVNTLLLNPAWIDVGIFGGMRLIEIVPSEPLAANALLIGKTVIYSTAYPKTRRRMEMAGIDVRAVDVSELTKAEGAVTCCSLIFNT